MKVKGLTVNFLGDSITQGAGASTNENVFHALVKKNLELKEARNYGIGGTRISRQDDGEPAYSEDFIKRAEKMEDADIVMVFGGTNDFGHGTSPLGKFSDSTPYSFYGALHSLIQYLIRKYTGKPIIFMTPLHRKEEIVGGEGAKEGNHTLYDYVCAIREVCEFYGLPVLDLYKTSMIQPQIEYIRENLCPDGLHPNDLGHKLIADRIEGFLLSL